MKKNIFILVLLLSAGTILFGQQETIQTSNLNSIMSAGTISVTIGGNFITNGTFSSSISERADQFVSRIYNLYRDQLLKANREIPENKYAFRNIILKRASGEQFTLNLLKFRKTGDFKDNPRLKNDDVLIFPPTDIERNFVTVNGAVTTPGTYNYFEGDKLSDIIFLCDGLNKAYGSVSQVKINRVSTDGKRIEEIDVPITQDYDLRPGDRIMFAAKEPEGKEYSVLVLGEVNMPGRIPITKSNSTLKEVIDRAGGLKESASLKRSKLLTGASIPYYFYSEYGVSIDQYYWVGNQKFLNIPDPQSLDKMLKLEDYMMFRNSDLTIDDSVSFFQENQLRVLNQGTSRDFSELDNPNSEIAKHVVKDRDIILIPPKNNNVYVFGQVLHPGNLTYKQGEDISYYLKQAGGVGEFAVADEIAVIKGGSRQWVRPTKENKVNIEEGDYIFVPKKPIRTFNQYVSMWGSYIGIIGSVATVILLLLQLKK